MPVANGDLCRITETMWSTVLNLELPPRLYGDVSRDAQETLVGYVELTGAWDGAVALRCPVDLLGQAAAIMFGTETTTDEERRDTLRELTNIIGGNTKALLPEPCRLSLPMVTEDFDAEFDRRGWKRLHEITYAYEEHFMQVTLLQRPIPLYNEEESEIMEPTPNQRGFTRAPVRLKSDLISDTGEAIKGESRDVSVSGMFLLTDTPPPVGTECRAVMVLQGEDDEEVHLEVQGRVVRTDNEGIGIEFTAVLGLEGFDHLRNLVRYNAEAPAQQVEEEFQLHRGLKRRR